MDPATELNALQARHQQLLREHAVLEAREAEKERRRAELRALLEAAGVNPDQPEEERARLEVEVNRILAENKAALDDFEKKLKEATRGQALPTEEDTPHVLRAPKPPSEPSIWRAPEKRSEPLEERAPLNESEPREVRAPQPPSEPSSARAPSPSSETIDADIELT